MNNQLYFKFDHDLTVESEAPKGGYLRFLPPNHHYSCSEGVQHSFFETDHIVVLEIRGDVDVYKGKFSLLMENIVFWQEYQFINMSLVRLPGLQPIVDQRSFLFASKEEHIELQMNGGKQWLWLVGYKKESMGVLMEEYAEALTDLRIFLDDCNLKTWISSDFTVGHRFRDVLTQIEGFSFRPLRSRLEMALALCRLLELSFVQIAKLMSKEEYSKLKIYYLAIEYVRQNFTSNITKESVAYAMGTSVRTLQRAFEGRTVKLAEFILSLRMNRAKELLLTQNLGVKDVSTELHFSDQKYFSREFKKLFAKSPSAFVAIGESIGLRKKKPIDEED